MKKAIEVKDYSFRYEEDGSEILKNSNLSLEYGDFVLLSGLSGQGKSTLLYSIAGIIPHSIHGTAEGSILIDGENINDQKTVEVCKKVGCVLQNADSQIFHSVVKDEIAFGCENMCLPPEEIAKRIQEGCYQMELGQEDATETLSGGQKQRLITACIVVMGQKILLLDEPLANLDGDGAVLVLETLKQFCSDGYAVLLAEHRIDMVLPYATRTIYLEEGAVVEVDKNQALHHMTKPIEDSSKNCSTAEPCLTLKNMNYIIKEKSILQNLTFSISKGERVVILGENGCGKSTLLKIMAKLLKPTSGEIQQNLGKFKRKRDWFKKVGYVYQDPGYQLFMPTVWEEVAFGAKAGATEKYMDLFDLESIAEQHPQALSEGQKRRLSIAAVCASEPELLLMDEPTVGQDYENLKRIVQAVNHVYEELGNTIITVTHDYRCAGALADRVLWFHQGTLYKDGGKELVDEYFSFFINKER